VNDEMKKLLEQQMVLLSERSKEAEGIDNLAMLSRAMVEIAEIFSR